MRTHYERTPEQIALDAQAAKIAWAIIDNDKLAQALHLHVTQPVIPGLEDLTLFELGRNKTGEKAE